MEIKKGRSENSSLILQTDVRHIRDCHVATLLAMVIGCPLQADSWHGNKKREE
jgi:hypothetical protein